MITRVITLGGERMKSFQRRMGQKLPFEFFNGFTPEDISDVEPMFEKSNIYEYAHERNPKAVIACAKSHLWLWELCIRLDEEMLILEDDVTFSDPAAEEAFNLFIHNLNDYEYDVFFFDGDWGEKYVVSQAHRFHSGCAYVMTPRGAKTILEKLETRGFDEAVDWEILNSQNYGVRALAFERAILVPSAEEKSTLKI
jgi:GR25 family glycosyltransferase involved in LPS biosynthesis